ncbi:MAG: hypothetical protein J5858_08525 [Lentisphaeria bacterium]|nr:hypothetical protein [Lentisphaeria bacterium]
MASFMKKMKSAAEQAKVKDHPLFTREYGTEIRNAYFSGAAASLCFLDDELDAEEQHALALLGQALHLSADEISEVMKTVQGVGEDDKMEFLQEVFALMDSDYLKYALLTDIHTLCSKKGKLTEDETDFINTSAEILFGEEKNVFELWKKGLTLDNAENFSADDADNAGEDGIPAENDKNSERDPFFVKLEERNKTILTTVIDELKTDSEFCQSITTNLADWGPYLLEGYDAVRSKFFQDLTEKNGVTLDKPINPAVIQEDLKNLVRDDVPIEDLMKMKTMQDLFEVTFNNFANVFTDLLNEHKKDKTLKEIERLKQQLENDSAEMKRNARLACFAGIDDRHVFVAPNIPYDKLTNAISAYAPLVNPDDVLVLFDDTAFGGARDGMLITHDCVCSHEIFMDPVQRFFFKSSEIRYGGKKIYIDGEQVCSLSLASESVIKELAEGIAGLTAFTE